MKTKLILLIFSVLTIFSFRATASTEAPNMDAFTLAASAQEQAFRYPCCDRYSDRYCDIRIEALKEYQAVTPQQMMEAAKAVTTMASPIYIGGARYSLSKSDFSPVYTTRVIYEPCLMPEPITVNVLSGYEATFAVSGDYSQDLFFDISGRSDKSMNLAVSCGSFSATDSGTKWVISKSQNTGGTCKAMKVKYSFSNSTAPTSIDLNITISEELY
ncbi:hypothetical protein [Pseudoalteromonas sp. MMG022]|uniref:hypothetical protein n=1 Tax=Pseudoalteromonas sp. MMG022 TaxID=2909978 RepID=UPI001F316816|nr:hypothetical protein [Pseudoalteromonas sp. MMG022]MCF6436390.1 hypothetical protein [Pseudoalteromonas sp. MMG022]